MNQKLSDERKFVKKLEGLSNVVDSMDDLFNYQLEMTRVFKRYLSHTRCQISGFYRLLGLGNDQHIVDYRKFTITKVTKQNKKKRKQK